MNKEVFYHAVFVFRSPYSGDLCYGDRFLVLPESEDSIARFTRWIEEERNLLKEAHSAAMALLDCKIIR